MAGHQVNVSTVTKMIHNSKNSVKPLQF